MPVDARIALAGQAFRLPEYDVGKQYLTLANIRQAQQQGDLAALQLEEARGIQGERQALASLHQQYAASGRPAVPAQPGTPAMAPLSALQSAPGRSNALAPEPTMVVAPGEGTTYSAYPAAGRAATPGTPAVPAQPRWSADELESRGMAASPTLWPEYAQRMATIELKKAEQKRSQLALAQEQLAFVMQALGASQDQDSWTAARDVVLRLGGNPANIPERFSPAAKQQVLLGTVSTKDQLLLAEKELDRELARETQLYDRDVAARKERRLGSEYLLGDTGLVPRYANPEGLPPGVAPAGAPGAGAAPGTPVATTWPSVKEQQGRINAESQAAGERLKKLDAQAEGATTLSRSIDEVDAILQDPAGIYERGPTGLAAMKAYEGGLTTDKRAGNTLQVKQLGAALTLASSPSGSLGAGVSNADRETLARAGGDLERAQNATEIRAALARARRAIASIHENANRQRGAYERTGKFPPYGTPASPAPGAGKPTPHAGIPPHQLTTQQLAEELAALEAKDR